MFDEDLQRAVQRNRNRTTDDIFNAVQPFGQEYSAAVAALVSSAALTMDKSTEAWVRHEIDAPDQDEQTEMEPDPNDANEPAEQELQPGDPGYVAPQNGKPTEPVAKPAAYK